MKVATKPHTSAISPTRSSARLMVWLAMSPRAPEPATDLSWRQLNGTVGSVMKSWSKVPRNWVISPSSPASIISLARACAGFFR